MAGDGPTASMKGKDMSEALAPQAPAFDVIGAIRSLSATYETFDQDAACARGWCLNQYGDGMIGIVSDDDSDVFADGGEAHEHVVISAVTSQDAAYRDLCAKAVVIEAASIAIRDAIPEEID